MLPRAQPNCVERAFLSIRAGPGTDACGEMLEHLDTPIFLLAQERERQELLYANRAFLHWAGCGPEARRALQWHRLCRIRGGDAGLARLQAALLAGQDGQALVRTRSPDGTLGWAQLRLSRLPSAGGPERFIGQLRDVTAERNERERLRRQSLRDALTGLPNRALLQVRLERAIARARDGCAPFALVFMDLDRFKQVNDTIGHQAADELLRQIARRLRRGVRAQDTVARLYGDEFALLLAPLPCERCADGISHRVAAWLRQPFAVADLHLVITCSVGVAFYPDGTDGRHLLEHADHDMYRRKRLRHAEQAQAPGAALAAGCLERAPARLAGPDAPG